MTPIKFRRPQTFKVPPGEIRIEIFAPQKVYHPESGALTDIHIVPTLVLAGKNEIGEAIALPVDPQQYDEAVYRRFNDLTYHIGKMRRLAELNLDFLTDTLALYLRVHPLERVLDRNAACRRMQNYISPETFDRLTFENLRGLLSCIVKTDPELHTITALDTPEKRKDFTRLYDAYIEDRNRYTHGILFFLYPEFRPVLRIKDAEGAPQYIRYEPRLFTQNLQIFDSLDAVLGEIRKKMLAQIEPGIQAPAPLLARSCCERKIFPQPYQP